MRSILAACVLVAAALPIAAEPSDPAIAEAIRRADDSLAHADAAGDASAVLDIYADDAVVFAPGEEPLRGKAAIRRWISGRFSEAPRIVREQYETATIDACGDLAVETGSVAVEEEAGGATRTRRTPRLAVWNRQGDGTWKIAREAWGGEAAVRAVPAPAASAAPATAATAPASPAPAAAAATPAAPAAPPEPTRVVVAAPTDVISIPDPRSLSDGFVRTISDRLRSRAARIRKLEGSGSGSEALRAAISKADRELQTTIRDVGWIDVARFGVPTSCDAAFIVSVSGDPALVRSAVPWMKDLQTNPEGGACYAKALEAWNKLPPR